MKRLDSVSRWVLGAVLWASTCTSCAPAHLEPMSWRPDTRRIQMIHLDSAAVSGTMDILQAALPNEASVCYMGKLYDSLATRTDSVVVNVQVMEITSVVAATQDSADQFHVFGPDCPSSIIAVGHSHPHNVEYEIVCDHSDDDANLVYGHPGALVSLVWCEDGVIQFLFQDGRRELGRWRS